MNKNITYKTIEEQDFDAVIQLATLVHGEGYINLTHLTAWVNQGIKNAINAGFVAYDDNTLVGFRLTFSANQWQIDNWCSPKLWAYSPDEVCYFKCNTVDEKYRGFGIGSMLLKLAVDAVKAQGAKAGVSHLWMQSPGNSAVKYFTKCGGKLIQEHPDRWNYLSAQGYICPICDKDCHCSAAEMIITFN